MNQAIANPAIVNGHNGIQFISPNEKKTNFYYRNAYLWAEHGIVLVLAVLLFAFVDWRNVPFVFYYHFSAIWTDFVSSQIDLSFGWRFRVVFWLIGTNSQASLPCSYPISFLRWYCPLQCILFYDERKYRKFCVNLALLLRLSFDTRRIMTNVTCFTWEILALIGWKQHNCLNIEKCRE